MTHQLNIFFLLFGALQGILVGLFMLRNSRKRSSNVVFILFLVAVGTQLTFKVITKQWLMDHAHFLYNASYYLPYLVAPLFYLFIRTRTGAEKIRPLDLIHALPFVFGLLHLLLLRVLDYSYWTPYRSILLNPYVVMSIQLLSLILYSVYSWRAIQQVSGASICRGLKHFVVLVSVCEAIIIVTLTVMFVYYPAFPNVKLLFLVLTLLIYWISYKVISEPELFIERNGPTGEGSAQPTIGLKVESTPKYSHSGLKSAESGSIANALTTVMQKEKLYLDSTLTIESLAAHLNISRHHLSQVINERFNQTYFEFINNLRLEEASIRLSNPKFAHYTIAAVALDSGFNSVSNFNEVFKRRYGVTPSKFRGQSAKKLTA